MLHVFCLRGQTSLEFLYSMGIVLFIFVAAAAFFSLASADLAALSGFSEARRSCHEIAAQISTMANAGDGASSLLLLPAGLSRQNYSVYVSGPNRSISVWLSGSGAGCRIMTSSVSNGSSGNFYLSANSSILRNAGGVVVVG